MSHFACTGFTAIFNVEGNFELSWTQPTSMNLGSYEAITSFRVVAVNESTQEKELRQL